MKEPTYCERCGKQNPTTSQKYCSRECYWEARGFHRMVLDERAQDMIAKWASDEYTLQQIADEHGVTRERVRQIIKKYAPNLSNEKKINKRLAHFEQKLAGEREKYAPRECSICGTTFYHPRRRRYCVECAKEYNKLRLIADPRRHEMHRLYMTIMHLRDPEKVKNSMVVDVLRRSQFLYKYWQEHGYLPPPNRRYVYGEPGRDFLERIGVDRWHQILKNFDDYYADETRRIVLTKDPGYLPGLYVDPADYDKTYEDVKTSQSPTSSTDRARPS